MLEVTPHAEPPLWPENTATCQQTATHKVITTQTSCYRVTSTTLWNRKNMSSLKTLALLCTASSLNKGLVHLCKVTLWWPSG